MNSQQAWKQRQEGRRARLWMELSALLQQAGAETEAGLASGTCDDCGCYGHLEGGYCAVCRGIAATRAGRLKPAHDPERGPHPDSLTLALGVTEFLAAWSDKSDLPDLTLLADAFEEGLWALVRRARDTGLPFTLYGLGEVQIGRSVTAMHWHEDAIVTPPCGGGAQPLTCAVYPVTGSVELAVGTPDWDGYQRVTLHGEQIRAAARYLQAMADGLDAGVGVPPRVRTDNAVAWETGRGEGAAPTGPRSYVADQRLRQARQMRMQQVLGRSVEAGL